MRPRRLVTATVFMSLVVLLVLSGAACIYTPGNGWPPSPLDPPSGTVTTDRPFSSIESHWLNPYDLNGSAGQPMLYVLRSHDELIALRDSFPGYPSINVPEIDFEKELVIVLAGGPLTDEIWVERLQETPERIIVRATKTIYLNLFSTGLPRGLCCAITTATTDKPFVLSLRVPWPG